MLGLERGRWAVSPETYIDPISYTAIIFDRTFEKSEAHAP